ARRGGLLGGAAGGARVVRAALPPRPAPGPLEAPPADRGVLAFGVLAHYPEVDVALLAPRERRLDPRHEPHRPQVHVEVEAAAHRHQQLPKRDVVGHAWKAASAEENGIVMPDGLQSILGHHAAVLGAVLAAPGEFLPIELDAEFPAPPPQ